MKPSAKEICIQSDNPMRFDLFYCCEMMMLMQHLSNHSIIPLLVPTHATMGKFWRRFWLTCWCMDPKIPQLYIKVFIPIVVALGYTKYIVWIIECSGLCFFHAGADLTSKKSERIFFIPKKEIWGSKVRKICAKA